MISPGRFINDKALAQISGAWRQGPAISFEQIKLGTGPIKHITSKEFFAAGAPASAGKPALVKTTPNTMPFGKHKGELMQYVKQSDPGYWNWCLENVESFEKKAAKAGLL